MYKTYRHLLAIISAAVGLVLVLTYSIAFGKSGFFSNTADLIQQTIPSLIASLLVFICVYFFIERFVDDYFFIDSISSLSSSEARKELFQERSIENLRSVSKEFETYRENLREEITRELDALRKATSVEERNALDMKLKKLYLKLNDVELRVANIDEKLALTNMDERDAKIKELTSEIQRLERQIASHREIAQKIGESAKKI